MANKDGKSKKKKKDASLDSSPTTSTIQTSPITTQRVTNRINIPVRQQIAWAKAYKRLMTSQAPGGSSSSSSSQTPRKFRQLNEPRVQEEYVEVDYVNTKPPAVFVDGYNIIGHINSVEGRNIDLEDARDCLIRYTTHPYHIIYISIYLLK